MAKHGNLRRSNKLKNLEKKEQAGDLSISKEVISKMLNDIRIKLLDLSKRNRLLNYRRNKSSIVIVDEQPKQVFQRIVNDGKPMTFAPLPEPDLEDAESDLFEEQIKTKEQLVAKAGKLAGIDIREELPPPSDDETDIPTKHSDRFLQTKLFLSELETRLRRIRSNARSLIEETGQNHLYLSIGFLQWKERIDTEDKYEAPLILIPVEVERGRIDAKTRCYSYNVKYTGEDLIPNLSLAEKLKNDFDLILPTFEDKQVVQNANGDKELDPEAYFDTVLETISNMKGWTISRKMVLGFFTFSKFLMYLDLDPQRWPNSSISKHNIIVDLLGGRDPSSLSFNNKDELDEETIIEFLRLVIDADSSQISAIVQALTGQNIVIQGPPGTGKSQTITNLIACFLEQEMSVLFVAEKMAALNVVHRNLEKVGLADFCLELHSYKAKKKEVLESLRKRHQQKYLDTEQITAEINHLKAIRQVLCEYVGLINSRVGPNKETIFEIFWKSESLRTKLTTPVSLTIDNVEQIVQKDILERTESLESLARFIEDLGIPKNHIWYGYKPVELYYGDHEIVREKLELGKQIVTALLNKVDKLLSNFNCDFQAPTLTISNLKALIDLGSKSIPKNLLADLAAPFLLSSKQKPWDLCKSLCVSIETYKNNVAKASEFINTSKNTPVKELKDNYSLLGRIEKQKLAPVTLNGVNDIVETCGKIISLLKQIAVITKNQTADGLPAPNTIADFESFLKLDSILRSKPTEIDNIISTQLFSKRFRDTLEEVIEKGKQLNKRKNFLSSFFDLSTIPSIEDLVNIRKVLRQYQGTHFAFFHADYRKVKKQLFGFLRERSRLKSGEIVGDLETLESFIQITEDYANNTTYQNVFGSLFHGVDTKVDRLEHIWSWSNLLHATINSFTLARKLASLPTDSLSKWSTREELEEYFESIKNEIYLFTELLKDTDYEQLTNIAKTPIQSLISNLNNLKNLFEDTYKNILPVALKQNSTLSEIKQAIKSLIESINIHEKVSNNKEVQSLLKSHFKGIDTDTDKLNETMNWFREVIELGLPTEFLPVFSTIDIEEVIACIGENKNELDEDLNSLQSCLNSITEFGKMEDKLFWGNEIDFISLDAFTIKLEESINKVDHLVKWADYCRLANKAEKLGLNRLVNLIETGELDAKLAVNTYLHTVYNALARKILRDNPTLSTFARTQHEEKRKRFCELDRKIQELSQQRIAYKASRKEVPFGVGRGYIRNWTEMALLGHEFNITRRHIPIRRLVERAGNAIKALKPVFMMSPRSVAQFLAPGKHEFDVVIMDEASQIQPHEALGAIARAKQMIIVGDSKQLPPTTFFDTVLNNPDDEEREETHVDDTDSILDMSQSAHFPSHRLRWHYRSEHESLIAFSNAQWYDNDLVVFPSPGSSDIKLGIYYTFVEDATYAKGKNEVEADYVARKIIEHAKKHTHLSLGVGTFNIRQRELIEDCLARHIKNDSSIDSVISRLMKVYDGNEPLFIKNLENLQGDERDVIFISCTYGPDKETQQVYQRFGPITQKNGPRRLNVLFTRAKKRLEIFSSMQPEDIKVGYGVSEGAIALRKFLKYAQTGQLGTDFGIITNREPDSDFEIAVAQVLKNHGYNVVAQVGVAGYFVDIGVLHPHRHGEYILGIECDGATYHSSRFARDRDRLREEVLRRRGWNIHRIWSTDWFKNRGTCVEHLISKLDNLVKADSHVVREFQEIKEEAESVTVLTERKERMSGEELESRIRTYCLENIPRCEEIQKKDGFLNPELLKILTISRPTTLSDFRAYVPVYIRVNMNNDDIQYIDDILGIIEGAEGL